MMTADLVFNLDPKVVEKLLLEERSWDEGRAKVELVSGGVRVLAPDAASMRATLNSVLKVVQVHERMEGLA